MKLWVISQEENKGYDTFDSAVVAAETEDEAKKTHPWVRSEWDDDSDNFWIEYARTWVETPEQVKARYLGEAVAGTEAGVVVASFHAG